MDYDTFKRVFLEALVASKLPTIGTAPAKEVLELCSLERTCTIYVQPLGAEARDLFHVSGEIFWRWDPLHTARTRTTEEDLLTELLGDHQVETVETKRPWIRIDLRLRARVDYARSVPMPSPATWARWSHEATGRLETIERLVSAEMTHETADGHHEILAWQGDPEINLICTPLGELRLQSVEVHAFQVVDLPRHWDDPEREPDEGPHRQLTAMFRRVKAALVAWVDAADHFR